VPILNALFDQFSRAQFRNSEHDHATRYKIFRNILTVEFN